MAGLDTDRCRNESKRHNESRLRQLRAHASLLEQVKSKSHARLMTRLAEQPKLYAQLMEDLILQVTSNFYAANNVVQGLLSSDGRSDQAGAPT